ncbi:MAG: radical SAM family heme chaperone HemW [Caldilineaceae bacterium]|nr:radical SAM family heme chaperone HemW [Caldilineaceae bacterium]
MQTSTVQAQIVDGSPSASTLMHQCHAVQDRLGLYIHIPFCARKCPYCDFNTYAGLDDHFEQTVDALCREMGHWQSTLAGRTVDTVFFGGGTPTILTATQLAQLFATIHECFQLSPTCEITCEANPGTVDRAKFDTLYALGVNRLSIGVQSFQPEELAFLGRIHDTADVVKAFETARTAGFTNINLDFIFGLPSQTRAAWQATLQAALELAPEHLSLYSLIVEPNTPLHHWVEHGQVAEPDDDVAADLYETAMAQLAEAGYRHYEVSNWARASSPPSPVTASTPQTSMPPLACQHNLVYWRNQEYLGIGPGAHSHLSVQQPDGTRVERRWGNRKPVPGYIKRIGRNETVEAFCEEISPRLAMGETMMLGLRLLPEGVTFDRFYARHGVQLTEVFAKELADLAAWDLLIIDSERVRLTPRGILLGNQVFSYFLPEES